MDWPGFPSLKGRRGEEEDAFISLVEKVKRRGSIEIIKGEREREYIGDKESERGKEGINTSPLCLSVCLPEPY